MVFVHEDNEGVNRDTHENRDNTGFHGLSREDVLVRLVADHNVALFKLLPDGRVPANPPGTPDKEGGYKLAVRDLKVIRRWLKADPHQQLGTTAYGAQGWTLAVIDVDCGVGKPSREQALASWAALKPRLPATLTAETPSTGFHVYLLVPEALSNFSPWPGIDVRSGNGFVKAIGNTKGGRSYRITDPSPIAEMPADVLADLLTVSQHAARAEAAAARRAERMAAGTGGQVEWTPEVEAKLGAALRRVHPSKLSSTEWHCVCWAVRNRFGPKAYNLFTEWSEQDKAAFDADGNSIAWDREGEPADSMTMGYATGVWREKKAKGFTDWGDGFSSASADDFAGSTAIPDDDADADDVLMRELLDLLTWDGAPETVVFEDAYISALARIRGRDEAVYQRWRGLLKDAGVSYATLRALDRATKERMKAAGEAKKATAGAERAERMRASAERRNRDAAEPSDFNDPDTCVEWFNGRCAIVNVSGQTTVAYDWRPVVEFAGERSAELRFRDKRVLVVDDDGDADMVPAFRFWAQNPKRRLFDGVAFVPARYGSNDPGDDGVYNLWRGWGAPPADCSAEEAAEGCKLIRAHMCTIVCNGNEDHYRYLVRWLAHLVQRPWEKPGVAVVTRGKKRIGKDTLGTYISRMVGSAHSLHLAGSDRLVDRFNGDFKQALFTHVEEGSWGGDRKAENVLKSLISAPTMTVEDKFMPRLKIRNATRFFLSSNESWVVPASDDEARYFVLDVSEARRSDHAYFRAINAEMDGDGPAMLHRWLLEQDISDFEVRDVPRTDALRDQAIEGYRDVHAFVFDMLNGGHGFNHWTEAEPLEIAPKDLHARYLRAAEKQRHRFDGSIGPQQFTRRLKEVLPVAMGTGRMVRRIAKASRSFRLDLAQCRAEFEAQAGTIEWEDTGGDSFD